MNGFDIFVLIIVTMCIVSGLFRGLVREISGIIGLVAGFYGAATYYPYLLPYVEGWIAKHWLACLICFFVIFFVIVLLVGLFAFLIRKLLSIIFLGWVDRTFGLLFGFCKGVIISSVIYILLVSFIPGGGNLTKGAKTGPYLIRISHVLVNFIPGNFYSDMMRR